MDERGCAETGALDVAIAGLYAAFADCPAPAQFALCRHCLATVAINEADAARLLAVPLHELTETDLAPYARLAVRHWGTPDDLLHFLPRLLELLAGGAIRGDNLQLFQQLAAAGWREWPAPRPAAIEAFLHAWWRVTLASGDRIACRTALAGIGLLLDDLTPFLDAWLEQRTPAYVRTLAGFLFEHLHPFTSKQAKAAITGAWGGRHATRFSLVRWMNDDGVFQALEQANAAGELDALTHEFLDGATGLLRRWRRTEGWPASPPVTRQEPPQSPCLPVSSRPACACCGFLVGVDPHGDCSLCGWLHDPGMLKHRNARGGRNSESLNDAKGAFGRIGVSVQSFRQRMGYSETALGGNALPPKALGPDVWFERRPWHGRRRRTHRDGAIDRRSRVAGRLKAPVSHGDCAVSSREVL